MTTKNEPKEQRHNKKPVQTQQPRQQQQIRTFHAHDTKNTTQTNNVKNKKTNPIQYENDDKP